MVGDRGGLDHLDEGRSVRPDGRIAGAVAPAGEGSGSAFRATSKTQSLRCGSSVKPDQSSSAATRAARTFDSRTRSATNSGSS